MSAVAVSIGMARSCERGSRCRQRRQGRGGGVPPCCWSHLYGPPCPRSFPATTYPPRARSTGSGPSRPCRRPPPAGVLTFQWFRPCFPPGRASGSSLGASRATTGDDDGHDDDCDDAPMSFPLRKATFSNGFGNISHWALRAVRPSVRVGTQPETMTGTTTTGMTGTMSSRR